MMFFRFKSVKSNTTPCIKAGKRAASSGMALAEVLVTLLFLSSIVLPMSLMMCNNANVNSKGSPYFFRNTVSVNIHDEIDPDRPTFYNDYTLPSASPTTITDGGYTVSYNRQVILDTSGYTTDDLHRQVDYFTYDFSGNVLNKVSDVYTLPELRIDVGNTGDANGIGGLMTNPSGSPVTYLDSMQGNWINDTNAYDSNVHQVPGYVGTPATAANSFGTSISNVRTTQDMLIFQTYRQGSPIEYKFDLANGNYIVQLYFAEFDTTVTGTSPNRRNMDIYINSVLYDQNYCTAASFGGSLTSPVAEVRSFPVSVSSNTLDVKLQTASTGTDKPIQLSGIVVMERDD